MLNDILSTDQDIRKALRSKFRNRHKGDSSTLIIEELGLDHGANRIDIAVLNSSIHGYEIKSAKDTLLRFPDQQNAYSAALEKLTVVAAPCHIEQLSELLPQWSGLISAEFGPRGGIHFKNLRKAQRNPLIDLFRTAHLLWKSEAKSLLVRTGYNSIPSRCTRKELYALIAERVTLEQLRDFIKESFRHRTDWRDLAT